MGLKTVLATLPKLANGEQISNYIHCWKANIYLFDKIRL
jgi:hypothetical protein